MRLFTLMDTVQVRRIAFGIEWKAGSLAALYFPEKNTSSLYRNTTSIAAQFPGSAVLWDDGYPDRYQTQLEHLGTSMAEKIYLLMTLGGGIAGVGFSGRELPDEMAHPHPLWHRRFSYVLLVVPTDRPDVKAAIIDAVEATGFLEEQREAGRRLYPAPPVIEEDATDASDL